MVWRNKYNVLAQNLQESKLCYKTAVWVHASFVDTVTMPNKF